VEKSWVREEGKVTGCAGWKEFEEEGGREKEEQEGGDDGKGTGK
jgi:hypothetical protein